ncbi:FAD/NAD(P)-binding protein [Mycolicibacterium sp.]|uniref:FAD/NAD(P)-binding protein n=1 Tax=Mycolicibacterium sp. TaxID=2320850 RepID=UPI0028AE1D96|nr:FAD/NAD(P)-binding protein [Mycolicibacterium sp.]
MDTVDIAIIGAGPRGTAVLERLCANASETPSRRLRIHVIDPYEHGPGRIWRRDQPSSLLMNSVAGDITIFGDTSVLYAGPQTCGPNMYEWAQRVRAGQIPLPPGPFAEAVALQPWSYASRSLHGYYLRWAFEVIVDQRPANVTIQRHRGAATALRTCDRSGARYRIEIAGTASVCADAVVLSVGHYAQAAAPRAAKLAEQAASAGLKYIPPGHAAEADLTGIGPADTVILAGMGLTFFDYLSLLTVGRGGVFDTAADGLVYRRSGAEPMIYAVSRQGVPFRARADTRTAKVAAPRLRFLTKDCAAQLRSSLPLRFRRDVWPIIQKELAWAYYSTLTATTVSPEALAATIRDLPPDTTRWPELIDAAVGPQPDHLDWDDLLQPCAGRTFASSSDFQVWIESQLIADYEAASQGPAHSPSKSVSASMRQLRSVVRTIVSHAGIAGDSYRDDVEGWFNGVNNMVASGPPRSRVAELIALRRGGLVEFVGPAAPATLETDSGRFVVQSGQIPNSRRTATCLIDAYLPAPDIQHAQDPLLADLFERGWCRAHRIANVDGSFYESGGLDIDESSLQLVRADGSILDQVFCFGPPLEGTQWVTASGARPHVNTLMLREADQIARTAMLLEVPVNPQSPRSSLRTELDCPQHHSMTECV